jgi:thioredoxin-related protein
VFCGYLYALNLCKNNEMVLERTAGEVIIRLPGNINWEDLQLMIKFIQYREKVSKSKAKQEGIDQLSSEVNKQWWAENKHRFLKEE